MKSYIFVDPLDSQWNLRLDSGVIITGILDKHPDNNVDCLSFTIPLSAPDKNGATLSGDHPDYFEQSYHGILYLNEPVQDRAMMMIDIFNMIKVPPPVIVEPPVPPLPPTTGPDPNADPLQIINYVFESTRPNLATASGCGLFTEDVCDELHKMMHPGWGHVKKTPGQNQFNGHAVDAIMLLVPSGGTAPAIYDIIFSSASAEAKPVFNYADPVDNSLWYYPAKPISSGQDMRSITVWHPGKK